MEMNIELPKSKPSMIQVCGSLPEYQMFLRTTLRFLRWSVLFVAGMVYGASIILSLVTQ